MVRAPDYRLEGPGFESRYRQVGGSVLIHPPCRNLGYFVHPISTCTCQPGRVGQQHQQAKHNKVMAPQSPATPKTSMTKEPALVNYDYVQGANNLWVKNIRQKSVTRLNVATYNVRTLLRDEHIQELEEEFRKTGLVWAVKKKPPTIPF